MGAIFRGARSVRQKSWAFAALAIALSACDGNGSRDGQDRAQLPMFFRLDATAATQEGGFTVECRIDYVLDIAGEVSRTDAVVEYVGTMGGGANRSPLREDGSGVAFFADAHYPRMQVLHILPSRVQIVSLDHPPDEPSSSRFWGELRFFEGALQPDGSLLGAWTCAPLDTEYGGIVDDSVFAEGVWTGTPLPR
jgi:hypothetical protein